MRLKIGVISAHPDAEAAYGRFADEFNCKLIFNVGFWKQSRELGVMMQEKYQVDALITVGVPMEIFFDEKGNAREPRITVPIYPILATNYDVLKALHQSRELGKNPAFAEVGFFSTKCDMEQIQKLLGSDVAHYFLPRDNQENIERTIRNITYSGADVLVTNGGFTYNYALSLGFPVILVMPEPRTFGSTLEHVRAAFVTRKMEVERSWWLNAVFDNSQEGILVIDTRDRIVIMNRVARRVFGISADQILQGCCLRDCPGKSEAVGQLLKINSSVDVVHCNNLEYVIKKDRLYNGIEELGTMFHVNPAHSLQKMELDARRKINEHGFVARATFADIKGSGAFFSEVKQKAAKYAHSKSNVVLYGESGSGKELFAQSIHNASLCSDGPFVAVNCIVLTESLLESELFGYEEGSFTGAKKGGKAGLFELAHKGTLFLDEIGDMPLNLQGKLLRVLQERVVRPVGGSRNIPVDVRCIFATNKDLKAEVEAGRFRSDLYYRIHVLTLHIPPLRQHKEDLGEIAETTLQQLTDRMGSSIHLSKESIFYMQKYDWPGNVRELHNFLERVVSLEAYTDEAIRNLLNELMGNDHAESPSDAEVEKGKVTLTLDTIHNMELAVIKKLYVDYHGDLRKVGMTLGISTSSVYRKVKEIELPPLNKICQKNV